MLIESAPSTGAPSTLCIEDIAERALRFREIVRQFGDDDLTKYADLMLFAVGKSVARKRGMRSNGEIYTSVTMSIENRMS